MNRHGRFVLNKYMALVDTFSPLINESKQRKKLYQLCSICRHEEVRLFFAEAVAAAVIFCADACAQACALVRRLDVDVAASLRRGPPKLDLCE
jgi:hypothetical protein